MRKFRAVPGKGIVASTVISSLNDNTWYRCVEHSSDFKFYQPEELGIHCGSLEQAQSFNDRKYKGSGDIYEIVLNPGVSYSAPVSDFEVWNSIEAINEILSDGFNYDTSIKQITLDARAGELSKSNAKDYLISKLGNNCVVVYENEIEMNEEDIIILDESSISSFNLVKSGNDAYQQDDENKLGWPDSSFWGNLDYTDGEEFEDAWMDYLSGPENKVNDELEVFPEPSIQGYNGSMFIFDESQDNQNEPIEVNFSEWCETEAYLASKSDNESDYENNYSQFLLDLMEQEGWER